MGRHLDAPNRINSISEMRRHAKSLLVSVATLALFLIALAGLEVSLRLSDSSANENSFGIWDPALGWIMREPRYSVEDAQKWKPNESLLFLGDSIGWQQESPRSSLAAIAQRRGIPLLNLSAIGYGTDQEYLSLLDVLPRVPPPKMVVLSMCVFNDFVDNGNAVNSHDNYRPKPRFTLENGVLVGNPPPQGLWPQLRFRLFQDVRSTAFIFKLIQPPSVPRPSGDGFTFGPWLRYVDSASPTERGARHAEMAEAYRTFTEEQINITRALVDEIAKTARKAGARFAILANPGWLDKNHFRDGIFEISPALKGFYDELPYIAIDVDCEYRRRGDQHHDAVKDSIGHPSTYGRVLLVSVLEELFSNTYNSPCQFGARQ